MPRAFGSPEHWRDRAKEARSIAEQIKDPEARRAMLAVAESYEKIARRAEMGSAKDQAESKTKASMKAHR